MKKKEKKNYLDYIPICAPGFTWEEKKGIVTIKMENKGFYNWLAQKLFKRPRFSYIDLDEFGSFVWKQMDGKRTIYEISEMVREHFGDRAEPVVERFIDSAVMGTLNSVTIIHGKGTGALRKAVHQMLRKNPAVKSFRLGVYGEGEAGVTVVELR